MPWQECNLMDERLKFIAGLRYKILDRYNSCGLEGLPTGA